MWKKIKLLLKKYWYYIALVTVIFLSAIGIKVSFGIFKDKKKEKKKENIIDKNENQINKIDEQGDKHEKIINDSNDNYNNLINGKFKK